MQRVGIELTYKGNDTSKPMTFVDVEEILEYFDHNATTQLDQFAGDPDEDEEASISTLEFNMNAASIKRLIADLAKAGIEHNVTTGKEAVNIDDDSVRMISYTFISMNEYTLKLR